MKMYDSLKNFMTFRSNWNVH